MILEGIRMKNRRMLLKQKDKECPIMYLIQKKWPLFEFKAFRTDEEEYYLFVGIDLLIADGGSVRIFIRQLLDFLLR